MHIHGESPRYDVDYKSIDRVSLLLRPCERSDLRSCCKVQYPSEAFLSYSDTFRASRRFMHIIRRVFNNQALLEDCFYHYD